MAKKKENLKKFEKLQKNVEGLAKAKLSNRQIVRNKQVTIHIPEREVGNIFHEENRFFKGNFEQEKRSMFSS